jgi:hypothetical protein
MIATLLLGVAVGLGSVFLPEAALSLARTHESSPWIELDSIELRAREAAINLFRRGCLEVRVLARSDRQGLTHVTASCAEWRQGR